MRLFRILASWIKRRHPDAALDLDIQAHLELLTDDYLRRGLSPDEARGGST
jgi:hypothetical protein